MKLQLLSDEAASFSRQTISMKKKTRLETRWAVRLVAYLNHRRPALCMMRSVSVLFVAVALTGCVQNPDEKPANADLVGTWIPTTHNSRPPTQFLRLNADYSFVATNFPVSTSFGQATLAQPYLQSGTGIWRLESSYAAWDIRLPLPSGEYAVTVRGRKRPFVLTQSVQSDDDKLKARRLEDFK